MAAGDVDVKISNNLDRIVAHFNGVNSYLTLGEKLNQMDNSKDYSYNFWFKNLQSANLNIPLIGQAIGATQRSFVSIIGPANTVHFSHIDTATRSKSGSFIPNQWNNITATYRAGSSVRLFCNGVELLGTATAGTGTPQNFLIGAGTVISRYANVLIYDVKIYDRCLTPDEAMDIYNGTITTSGLINRWLLTSDYNDSVGAKNATNSNASIPTKLSEAQLKAQRTLAGATGKYYVTGHKSGQILSAAITE